MELRAFFLVQRLTSPRHLRSLTADRRPLTADR